MRQILCHSEEETIKCGEVFGSSLQSNSVVCFFGDLGSGKTTFIKGLVKGYCGYSKDLVNSPTFVYLNIYTAEKTVYHFDLYRLRDSDEFLSMGFDEMFDAGGICLLEWSERIENILPENRINVSIEHMGDVLRKITF
jgi:tRNA threonylcarbamoyladenosine biosynthesis protein TsaE